MVEEKKVSPLPFPNLEEQIMRFRKYTKEDFIAAVGSSTSIRQVLIKLNVVEAGGNYQVANNYIKKLGLDISHFTGLAHAKGKKFPEKARPIEDYLSNKHSIQSHQLRKKLLNAGLFEHKCYCCGNIEWNQKPIPLELEHINGDHRDNNLNNLTLLCPNCHAQTETYRGKKLRKPKTEKHEVEIRKIERKKVERQVVKQTCIDCNKDISEHAIRCKSCKSKNQENKINWPTVDELKKHLETKSYVQLGKELGVSDNAIRKRIKNHS